MFVKELNGDKIIGTVGALQFDVIQYRLEHKYGAKCDYEPLSIHKACWIDADTPAGAPDFYHPQERSIATTRMKSLSS